MLKTKKTEKLEQKTKVVIFPLAFLCVFMNILILSIFKSKAKQTFKATVLPFKKKILPPTVAHRMLSSLSNKLMLYLLHYQIPCILYYCTQLVQMNCTCVYTKHINGTHIHTNIALYICIDLCTDILYYSTQHFDHPSMIRSMLR